eukprot:CAMPEP_0168517850 /NCGR_PEP_ID=MMETSP0405-20121227/6324_1 /TAXON_ID=498012 /ORGANISM="Trichosphaerium sp, Strain Am-I-7 wt" /LENGTH=184 /DNA_ID=CAMNT_0008537993 /DNA_START=586 /DNA_END=1137 /DNA_ORIENTATION=+
MHQGLVVTLFALCLAVTAQITVSRPSQVNVVVASMAAAASTVGTGNATLTYAAGTYTGNSFWQESSIVAHEAPDGVVTVNCGASSAPDKADTNWDSYAMRFGENTRHTVNGNFVFTNCGEVFQVGGPNAVLTVGSVPKYIGMIGSVVRCLGNTTTSIGIGGFQSRCSSDCSLTGAGATVCPGDF